MDKGESFEEQVLAAIPILRRVARRWAGNRADADDLVQSVVCKAFEGRLLYSSSFSMEAWLLAVMRNKATDAWRLSKRMVYGGGSVGGSWEPDFGDPILIRRLQHLKPQHLQVLVLVDVGGWTYREVAQVLQMPIGTVMSRLDRARKSLRALLKEEY